MFDSVGTGLCVLDANGVIESVNPELEEIVLRPAVDLVGQELWTVIRLEPDEEGGSELSLDSFRAAIAQRVEWRSDECELFNGRRRLAVSGVLTPLVHDDHVEGAVLLRAADAAMYRAKQDGRGCVSLEGRALTPASVVVCAGPAGRRRTD